MPDPVTLLDVRNVTKDYRGLRPLRIERLTLAPGDVLAVPGFDAVTAEILVNLLTGASLPDTGDVLVLGRSTADVADATEWLTLADRFGIVSERVVLLEGLTVAQNLAVPFTLLVDPVPEGMAHDARRLGEEAGLSTGDFDDARSARPHRPFDGVFDWRGRSRWSRPCSCSSIRARRWRRPIFAARRAAGRAGRRSPPRRACAHGRSNERRGSRRPPRALESGDRRDDNRVALVSMAGRADLGAALDLDRLLEPSENRRPRRKRP